MNGASQTTDIPEGTSTSAGPATAPPPERARKRSSLLQFPSTLSLLVFTLIVFLLQWLSSQFLVFDLVLAYGAKTRELAASGQWWRLVTPIFIHAGLWHLTVNMYSLYALGPAVEKFFGSRRMAAFYLLSGVGGVVVSQAFSPRSSVGASGAIFGLLGALATFLFVHREFFGQAGWRQFRHLVIVAVLNLALGLMPGVDNLGHVGGLLTGVALTWTLGPRLEPNWITPHRAQLVDRKSWRKTRIGVLIACGILLALAAATAFSPLGA